MRPCPTKGNDPPRTEQHGCLAKDRDPAQLTQTRLPFSSVFVERFAANSIFFSAPPAECAMDAPGRHAHRACIMIEQIMFFSGGFLVASFLVLLSQEIESQGRGLF
jgi:hypothetical protein